MDEPDEQDLQDAQGSGLQDYAAAHSPSENEIAALVTHYTCTRNCSGHKGNAAGCCTVAERDFIIGQSQIPKTFSNA
jgi:hypothetical protein